MAMDAKTLTEFTEEHFTIKVWGEGIKFEPHPKPCGRCQSLVVDQRFIIAKKNYHHRNEFWEVKCNTCSFKQTTNDLTKIKKL